MYSYVCTYIYIYIYIYISLSLYLWKCAKTTSLFYSNAAVHIMFLVVTHVARICSQGVDRAGHGPCVSAAARRGFGRAHRDLCRCWQVSPRVVFSGGCFQPQWIIELDDGKIYRKTLYLMVKTMVSCRFSLKSIQWMKCTGWCPSELNR